MNKNILIGIVVVLAGGVIWYMNSSKEASAPSPSPSPSPSTNQNQINNTTADSAPVTQPQNNSTTPQVKEFTVTGSNFKFDPSTITVNKGDKVKITFINSAGFHDWVIDDLGVKTKQIKGGAQEVVEFTANKTGSFEYYCSVGQHRAMGMKGTLVVK